MFSSCSYVFRECHELKISRSENDLEENSPDDRNYREEEKVRVANGRQLQTKEDVPSKQGRRGSKRPDKKRDRNELSEPLVNAASKSTSKGRGEAFRKTGGSAPSRGSKGSFRSSRGSFRAGLSRKEYVTQFPPLFERPGVKLFALLLLIGSVLGGGLAGPGKNWLDEHEVTSKTFVGYVSIPIVSVIFTYLHIWLALCLTFYPLTFRGCAQIGDTNVGCGWQGIMPNKAKKMARTSVHLMTTKVINVKDDIISKVDTAGVVKELEPVLETTVFSMFRDVAMKEEPQLWQVVPERVRVGLRNKANRDAPAVAHRIVEELKDNIDNVFDLSTMVEDAFVEEPALLNHMFISCGYNELQFIRDCGAYMGGIFGVVQVILWIWYSAGWMLPAFGFVVGLISNFIALKMIFNPVEAKHVCGLTIQGLFLRRQKEVSDVYAQIVAENVLYARNIIRAIIKGPLSDKFFEVLERHISQSTDKYFGPTKPFLRLFRSEQKMQHLKKSVADDLMQKAPDAIRHIQSHLDQAMGLEDLLSEKLRSLPSTDFEGLLHPVFQEDEWKLILMGGVLGIVIGCLQWAFLGG